jgi:type II secretory pathway component PulM
VKAWFERFTLREQLALLLMTAAIAVYLLVMFALQPLSEARAEMRARNLATAAVLQRVDAMAAQIIALRSQETATPGATNNLSALLNERAEAFQLRISRVQPNSRGAVQLRFESAPVEALLRWLYDLESRQALLVEELSLSQTSSAGVVSATLRVSALN